MSLLCNTRFPKIAKQDIVVVKKINIDNYKSAMMQSQYEPNVVKKLSLKHLYLFFYHGIVHKKVHQGLHSFTEEESKKYSKTGRDVVGIIPKGSWYYEEYHNGKVREYVSTKLKIVI